MKEKALWHSVDEKPRKSGDILVYDPDSDSMLLCYYSHEHDLVSCDTAPDGESWKWDEPLSGYELWLYAEDIKPEKRARATLLGIATQPKHDEDYNYTGAAISAQIEVDVPEPSEQAGSHRIGMNIELPITTLDMFKTTGYDIKAESFFNNRFIACLKSMERKFVGTDNDHDYILQELRERIPTIIEKSVAQKYYCDNLRTGEIDEYGIDQRD